MTSQRLAFVASLVIALAAPSAAGASTIGHGFGPGLAVDAAGTAYIAWSGPENPASLQFCRLPRGATACDIAHAIAAPGTTTSRAFVTVSGSRIAVVQYRYPLAAPDVAGVYEFISTNGGTSFDTGRIVGTVPFFEAVVGPGDTLSGATDNGTSFQNVPLDGASATPASAQLSVDHPYRATVGLVDAATPMTVFTSGDDAAQYRRYDGSGSLNDAANWTPAVDLGAAAYPKLAGGPSGLFLLATAANNSLFARKWNGTSFGPPVTVSDRADAPSLHAFQDAAGRLHAVFARGDVDGLHLIHAVSDDGTTWRSGTAVTQSPPVGIADTRVATAPDHAGVAVMRAGNEIRVTAVGPDAPAGTSPPPPGGGGQQPPPAPTPVFHQTVVVRPVSGIVRVRRPGSRQFVTLTTADAVPLGSTIDVKAGVLALSSVPKPAAAAQTSTFYAGIFKVTQPGSITQLALTETLAPCKGRAAAAAANPKRASCGATAPATSARGAGTAPRRSAAPNGSSRTPARARSPASPRASSPSATTSGTRRSPSAPASATSPRRASFAPSSIAEGRFDRGPRDGPRRPSARANRAGKPRLLSQSPRSS